MASPPLLPSHPDLNCPSLKNRVLGDNNKIKQERSKTNTQEYGKANERGSAKEQAEAMDPGADSLIHTLRHPIKTLNWKPKFLFKGPFK